VQWMIEIKATINLWLWPGAMLLAWSFGEYLFKRVGLPRISIKNESLGPVKRDC